MRTKGDTTGGSWNQGRSGIREGPWLLGRVQAHPVPLGGTTPIALGLFNNPVNSKGDLTLLGGSQELLREITTDPPKVPHPAEDTVWSTPHPPVQALPLAHYPPTQNLPLLLALLHTRSC